MSKEDQIAREYGFMKEALSRIAAYTLPDDMEEDDDEMTEWGCPKRDAVEMAYENVVYEARSTLQRMAQTPVGTSKKSV